MIGIYCITNKVNGKKYFGQSIDIERRKKEYFNEGRFPNEHLKSAFNKYGKENFKFEIIKCCKEKYLDRFEKLYIRIYDTMNRKKGYNKDSGGNLNKHPSYETKKRMSENHADVSGKKNPNYGNPSNYKHSKETIKKISENHVGMSDKKHTPEARKKISENHADFSKEKHPQWKDYARIIKAGVRNGKQRYMIRYNGKDFFRSISKEWLYEKWYDKYPDIKLIDETVVD